MSSYYSDSESSTDSEDREEILRGQINDIGEHCINEAYTEIEGMGVCFDLEMFTIFKKLAINSYENLFYLCTIILSPTLQDIKLHEVSDNPRFGDITNDKNVYTVVNLVDAVKDHLVRLSTIAREDSCYMLKLFKERISCFINSLSNQIIYRVFLLCEIYGGLYLQYQGLCAARKGYSTMHDGLPSRIEKKLSEYEKDLLHESAEIFAKIKYLLSPYSNIESIKCKLPDIIQSDFAEMTVVACGIKGLTKDNLPVNNFFSHIVENSFGKLTALAEGIKCLSNMSTPRGKKLPEDLCIFFKFYDDLLNS